MGQDRANESTFLWTVVVSSIAFVSFFGWVDGCVQLKLLNQNGGRDVCACGSIAQLGPRSDSSEQPSGPRIALFVCLPQRMLNMHTHTYTRTHTYTHTHRRTNVHTHTHTHTPLSPNEIKVNKERRQRGVCIAMGISESKQKRKRWIPSSFCCLVWLVWS